MKPPLKHGLLASSATLLIALVASANAATFDDFNVNEGHFGNNPTDSGTTAGLLTTSTANRVTTDSPREGNGHEKLVLLYNGTETTVRCRFLSGGGTVANNISFTTTSGTDGYIGYYLKTTNVGWVTSINLDGPAGSIADMDGSSSFEIVPDGQWHLYEWSLDSTTDWGAVPGIGGGHSGSLQDTQHTIDSVYFRYTNSLPTDAATVNATIYMDFVALNPVGSVSNLLQDPCINTSGVLVNGPLGASSPNVLVAGVATNATAIKVYQDSGAGFVLIGTKTSDIVAGDNPVTVSGLIKGARVAATQVVAGQEGCPPQTGVFVGGGANPSVRLALSIRETGGTGPIGDPNPDTAPSGNIHFLGATALSGGAPVDASIIYPSNDWQTITFYRGPFQTIADVPSIAASVVAGPGYDANATVFAQVHAYHDIPENGTRIFSLVPAYSEIFTSNDVFKVQWSWPAVAGADGYRLIRNGNEYVDVTSNSFTDDNTGWQTGSTVTPTSSQIGRSVKWNVATGDPNPIGTTNDIPGDWGILEALSFAIYDGDSGPFDIYIDGLQNGTTVFQNFDSLPTGTNAAGFREPSFSGSTSAGLLTSPDIGLVSDAASDTSPNSFHVSWQFNGTNASKWLRLTTSGRGDPMVDLNQTISFRLLMLPAGSVFPGTQKTISVTRDGNNVILNWTGTAYVQSADDVAGPYTDITGLVAGPYTNAIGTGQKFFRLRN